jgi:hypothetical protein
MDQDVRGASRACWKFRFHFRESLNFIALRFLQKADGRFWPDFVCELPDGKILVVEYRGERDWANAADDRAIGDLWAELSGDRCRFVMIRQRQWQ